MINRRVPIVVVFAVGIAIATPMILEAAACVDSIGVWADGPVKALATRGHLAFAGAGPVLMVIDVEDPALPELLSRITLPGTILDLAVDGDLVVAALGVHGAAVVDISDPSAPSQIAILNVDGFAEAVATAVSMVAVVVSSGPVWEDSWQLDFFDFSEVDDPRLLGSIEHPGSESFYSRYDGVAMDDRFAYWASGATTLVIDVADPSGPRLVNQHLHQGLTHCWVVGAAVSDGRLVIAHNWLSGDLSQEKARLGVFAVDSTGEIERIGSWLDEDTLWGSATVSDDRVAIFRYSAGILILAIDDPHQPSFAGRLDLHYTDSVNQLALGDGSLLASDGDLRIADLRDPFGLLWVPGIDTADRVVAATADKRRAYVATLGTRSYQTSYLHTLDLSLYAQPLEVARAPFSTRRLIDIEVFEDRLVTISKDDGVVTYDVSNPESPTVEARMAILGVDFYPQDSLVAGSEVVYVLQHGVVSVLDFSVPSDPVVVNEVAIDAGVRGLSMRGDLLMVSTSTGMWLFDAAEERFPFLLSVIDDVGTWLRGGAVGDGAVYLGDDSGIHIFDISSPEQPESAGFIRIPDRVERLVVSSGLLWVRTLYVSPRESGDLLVYDIRNPLHPVLVESRRGPRGMSEVLSVGPHALVASEFEGLEVFSTRCRQVAETSIRASEID